jgi:hypothetical protein
LRTNHRVWVAATCISAAVPGYAYGQPEEPEEFESDSPDEHDVEDVPIAAFGDCPTPHTNLVDPAASVFAAVCLPGGGSGGTVDRYGIDHSETIRVHGDAPSAPPSWPSGPGRPPGSIPNPGASEGGGRPSRPNQRQQCLNRANENRHECKQEGTKFARACREEARDRAFDLCTGTPPLSPYGRAAGCEPVYDWEIVNIGGHAVRVAPLDDPLGYRDRGTGLACEALTSCAGRWLHGAPGMTRGSAETTGWEGGVRGSVDFGIAEVESEMRGHLSNSSSVQFSYEPIKGLIQSCRESAARHDDACETQWTADVLACQRGG